MLATAWGVGHGIFMHAAALQPRPGGLYPALMQALTEEAWDPAVPFHSCLRGQVLVGITAPIQPGSVERNTNW